MKTATLVLATSTGGVGAHVVSLVRGLCRDGWTVNVCGPRATDDLFGWHMNVDMPPSHVEEHWLTELRALGRYPGRVFVPTMHPQSIGHPGRLEMFERVLRAAKDLNLDLAQSFMVGDKASDIEAGKRAGCRTILLKDQEKGGAPDAPAANIKMQ